MVADTISLQSGLDHTIRCSMTLGSSSVSFGNRYELFHKRHCASDATTSERPNFFFFSSSRRGDEHIFVRYSFR